MVDAKRAKEIVETGYDRIAERYDVWVATVRDEERARYTHLLLDTVPEGASVLELGCGSGGPTTHALAACFTLTGVDISARQLAMARERIPQATFIHTDMAAVAFPPTSFAAVAAFYAIIHVPREEHAALLAKIAAWLQPGGLFVAAMGARGTVSVVEDGWLGTPMFFSHHDAETNRRLVTAAGLEIVDAREETADEDGVPVTFLWVVARKPATPVGG